MTQEDSIDLAARLRAGDPLAADELFDRYLHRLLALARNHLSARLGRRIGPEDVVQSAYRSFFCAVREQRFTIEKSGDLWRLLAAVAINKLRSQAARHSAKKRSLVAEESCAAASGEQFLLAEAAAREPTPIEAAALTELVEKLMAGLEPLQQQMLDLRLQGHTFEEIAELTSRSERTVRRLMDRIKLELEESLKEDSAL
ncbi:MAG TPA: sigma-70 family RNA polymerase sigma factor [Pirellulales bacterium]|jgi:RNA polymerase sigma-70 factor (ECF subfamily)|nr:sigma-70 family RNA polymerase sigma factor [Pirellulales bacterium]